MPPDSKASGKPAQSKTQNREVLKAYQSLNNAFPGLRGSVKVGGSYQALPQSHALLSLQFFTLLDSSLKLFTPHSQGLGVLSLRNALLEGKTQNSEVLMLGLHS